MPSDKTIDFTPIILYPKGSSAFVAFSLASRTAFSIRESFSFSSVSGESVNVTESTLFAPAVTAESIIEAAFERLEVSTVSMLDVLYPINS